VFVDTDHGFALGHDPSARIKSGVVVARLRNDDRDRLLFDRLDHPPTYLYKYETPVTAVGAPRIPGVAPPPPVPAAPVVVPWAPAALGDTLHFEAEAEWPALSQSNGYAVPVYSELCAFGSRALLLTPTPVSGRARATITVPVPQPGRYEVALRIVQGSKLPYATSRGATLPRGTVTLEKERWDWVDVEGAACADLATHEVVLTPPAAHLVLEAEGGGVALDRISLKRLP
jgi:hypothetical protein